MHLATVATKEDTIDRLNAMLQVPIGAVQKASVAELQQCLAPFMTVRNKRKPVLVSAWVDLSEKHRETLRLEVMSGAEKRQKISHKFVSDLQEKGLSPKEAAQKIIDLWEGFGLADATIATTENTPLNKILDYLANDWANEVKTELRPYIRSKRRVANAGTNDFMVERTGNQKAVKLSDLQNFVNAVANDECPDWRDVSMALAICTGRRMAEIHSSGVFTLTDKNDYIFFEGQAKTRGRTGKDEGYEIPVRFVEPQKIVEWIEYLESEGKRTEDKKEVNRKFSMQLSRVTHKTPAKGTYKDLRDVYAAVVLLDKPENMANNVFLSSILGHGEEDILTATTYNKFRIERD